MNWCTPIFSVQHILNNIPFHLSYTLNPCQTMTAVFSLCSIVILINGLLCLCFSNTWSHWISSWLDPLWTLTQKKKKKKTSVIACSLISWNDKWASLQLRLTGHNWLIWMTSRAPQHISCVRMKRRSVMRLTVAEPFLIVTLGVVALSAPVTPW